LPIIQHVDAAAALFAGLLTFFTPCTLPLLPGWLALVAGLDHREVLPGRPAPTLKKRLGVLLSTVLFVMGFSLVFISMGAAASALGDFLWEHLLLLRVAGAAIMVLFALTLLGVVRPAALLGERRFHFGARPFGLAGAFLVGMAFAAGWTPCSGPVLAALLSLAATERNLARGIELLVYFSVGLGLPFVVLSLMWTTLLPRLGALARFTPWVNRVLAVLLLILATLVLTDRLSWLNFGYGP
jgi:cytochrome c-type biogenesis protein